MSDATNQGGRACGSLEVTRECFEASRSLYMSYIVTSFILCPTYLFYEILTLLEHFVFYIYKKREQNTKDNKKK